MFVFIFHFIFIKSFLGFFPTPIAATKTVMVTLFLGYFISLLFLCSHDMCALFLLNPNHRSKRKKIQRLCLPLIMEKWPHQYGRHNIATNPPKKTQEFHSNFLWSSLIWYGHSKLDRDFSKLKIFYEACGWCQYEGSFYRKFQDELF